MRHYTRGDDLPEKKESVPAEQTSCEQFACPYGQPQPAANKGARALILIMIGIASAFVIGFGGYGIFLSVYDEVAQEPDSSQSDKADAPDSSTESDADTEVNPVGTGTDPDFAGLTFYSQSAETMTSGEIYRTAAQSVASVVVTVEDEDYYASAIVLTEDGYLLTTAHAVGYSREENISVVTADGKEREAVVVGFDSAWDLAVLKVDAENLIPAELAKEAVISVGDRIYTVTAAEEGGHNCILTQGIVAALDRDISYDSVSARGHFQTDAAVGISGSGGALVNEAGQITGLTISNSYLSDLYAGESYALPIERAEEVIENIIRNGYVPGKVRLGITGTSITKSEAAAYGVPQGVIILDVQEDSGFAGTGVEIGDVITMLAGEPVKEMADVAPILQKHTVGEQIEVELYRVDESGSGHSFTVTIILQEDTGQTQK